MSNRGLALFALVLLVPAPSLGVLAAAWLPGPVGQASFVVAKLWVLLLPVVWLIAVDKGRPSIPLPTAKGMGAACITGLGIFLIILAAYLLIGRRWIDVEFLRQRIGEIGLGTPLVYLAGAAYWCTFNSLAEEYVWRWFVFTKCEALLPRLGAVALSGLFFTLHHVIALDVYFDLRVTILASLGVWIGGATWSWLYLTYRNIWAAYVSHVFADLAVFGIGYVLVFGTS